MDLIDFTNCRIDLTGNYGGSDQKKAIIYDNKRYMIKFSDRISDANRNEWNSSYSNSGFSEYIGCNIVRSIGLDAQNTILGTMDRMSSEGKIQNYTVVACENFVPDDYELVEFKFIEGALFDEKPGKTPSIEHIYAAMTNPNEYFSKEFGKVALERYWDTFIVDTLLGNFDRHGNNWGYLINKNTLEISLAPIYDCGSCLYPQIADDAFEKILNNPEEIKKRIELFPKAALKIGDIEKTSYKEFLYSGSNKECNEALLKMMPRINFHKISDIVENTPGISDIRKKFYSTMLNERYNQLLLEPYIHLAYNIEFKEITEGDKQIIKKSLQDGIVLSYEDFMKMRVDELMIRVENQEKLTPTIESDIRIKSLQEDLDSQKLEIDSISKLTIKF